MRKAVRGPSQRLQAALDAIDFPPTRDGRNQLFADKFDMSLTSAQRMLTGDHVPSRRGLKQKIVDFVGISAAYWEYGLDGYCSEIIGGIRDDAWATLLRRLKDQGYSLDHVPTGLLIQLAKLVFRSAQGEQGEILSTEVDQVIELSRFAIESQPAQGSESNKEEDT